MWPDWVSSCFFWSITRWEPEGQPKAWASVCGCRRIVIDWLDKPSCHWLSSFHCHWHLHLSPGLDGRLRWWCAFSMTSSQWRAWTKVWPRYSSIMLSLTLTNTDESNKCMCVCLWTVSGAVCNEQSQCQAWALQFSCRSWFVTFMHGAGQQRSIDWPLQSCRSVAQPRNCLKIRCCV